MYEVDEERLMKQRDYKRRWREKNREHVRAYQQAYRAKKKAEFEGGEAKRNIVARFFAP